MSFDDDIKRFTAGLQADTRAHFINTVSAVKESIVNGSPLTGSPGQPVDTGNLRASFVEHFESESSAEISTNVEYAPYVEEGIAGKNHSPHYTVGGPHSVEQTVLNIQRIVDDEARKLNGGGL